MIEISPYVYIIIIIIVLIWIYVRFDITWNHSEFIRQEKIKETVQWLYRSVNDICYNCDMAPIYEIRESFHITYSEKINNTKGIIYLVIWDNEHQSVFNRNTLLYSVIHEITHILSPSINHKEPFDSIETLLLNKAVELLYYDPNIPLEPNYLTLDLDH